MATGMASRLGWEGRMLRVLEVAALRIEGLLKDYPAYSGKDAALYFLGLAYRDLDRQEDAQAAFARLREEHPESRFTHRIPGQG